jgi:hypothetical protein
MHLQNKARGSQSILYIKKDKHMIPQNGLLDILSAETILGQNPEPWERSQVKTMGLLSLPPANE